LVIDHHLAHSYSVIPNLGNQNTLIFTLDGEGSGLCATVSVFDGKNIIRISESSKSASLGYLYAAITTCLGMKPLEHEFKVMGLAPYAKKDKVQTLFEKEFSKIIWLNGLEFKSGFDMTFADCWYFDKLKYERFDNVSGALQLLVEKINY